MKYIDAEKLKSEIQSLIDLGYDKLQGNLYHVISIIDSIQQEQPEVDLEAFRREAAKDAMNGMLSAPQFWQNVWSHNPVNGKCNYPRQIALFAIACADELIKQLKEEKQ